MMYLSLLKGRVMWAALAVVAIGVVLGGVVGGGGNVAYAADPVRSRNTPDEDIR